MKALGKEIAQWIAIVEDDEDNMPKWAREWEGEIPFEACLKDEDSENLFEWSLTITGPDGTGFEGGTFYVKLDIPARYPTVPPKVTFSTKIFHPSVNASGTDMGKMCEDVMKGYWVKNKMQIKDVCIMIRGMMSAPVVDSPLESGIAEILKSSKEHFKFHAQVWSQLYADSDAVDGWPLRPVCCKEGCPFFITPTAGCKMATAASNSTSSK